MINISLFRSYYNVSISQAPVEIESGRKLRGIKFPSQYSDSASSIFMAPIMQQQLARSGPRAEHLKP